MSGQHCENYDIKRETAHCYPWDVDRCCTWSEVAWCCRWNLSAFLKICFCQKPMGSCFCFVLLYNKSLIDWPLGKQWISLPSNLSFFPSTSSRETLRFSGNKIHCFPQIFPLARDWSKHVTWPNIPQPKLGNNREYSTRYEKDLKYIKHNSLHLGRKYAPIFVLGHICSS